MNTKMAVYSKNDGLVSVIKKGKELIALRAMETCNQLRESQGKGRPFYIASFKEVK